MTWHILNIQLLYKRERVLTLSKRASCSTCYAWENHLPNYYANKFNVLSKCWKNPSGLKHPSLSMNVKSDMILLQHLDWQFRILRGLWGWHANFGSLRKGKQTQNRGQSSVWECHAMNLVSDTEYFQSFSATPLSSWPFSRPHSNMVARVC